MRNLLALLGAALVTFLAVGWYLDWYHVTPKPGPTAGHRSVQIDINSKKIEEDVNRGVHAGQEKLHDLIDKEKDGAANATAPGPLLPPATGRLPR